MQSNKLSGGNNLMLRQHTSGLVSQLTDVSTLRSKASIDWLKKISKKNRIGALFLLLLCSTIGLVRSRRETILIGPTTPAVCYRCDNYKNLMDGRLINGQPDFKKRNMHNSEDDSGTVLGMMGVASSFDGKAEQLCLESVNRTMLTKFRSSSDACGTSNFNGCFKLVTKSYQFVSGMGRKQLSVTVVTRNCAEIPSSVSSGCYSSTGGAGLERELCYCRGAYCNTAAHLSFSLWLSSVGLVGMIDLI